MAAVNFLFRSTKDEGFLNLRLLYRFNSTDYVFGAKTEFEVSKHYWTKQHKKKSKDIEITTKQTNTNAELNKIENHVLNAFNSVDPDEVNKEWLQTQIDYYYNPPKKEDSIQIPNNLIDYIEFYIENRKDELKETSIRKFRVIKKKMQRLEIFRDKQILIKEIDDNFKNEFVSYLKKEKYSQNTMQRELVFIKTFCKHAKFKGVETHPQLESLNLKRDNKIEKIYLSSKELKKIKKIDKDKLTDSLENVRDWLIISCYTGQRISDFMRFTDEQIRVKKGKHYLEFTQKKTDKLTTIPMHPKVLEILKKRNGKFPYRISDQKYNDYIKEVCKLAELNKLTKGSKLLETEPNSKIFRKQKGVYPKWELVTSHIGRRSLATNFYGKMPIAYLINMTNHGSEFQFLQYLGKKSDDLAKETFKYF
jgi:site-specific recombinase XerD